MQKHTHHGEAQKRPKPISKRDETSAYTKQRIEMLAPKYADAHFDSRREGKLDEEIRARMSKLKFEDLLSYLKHKNSCLVGFACEVICKKINESIYSGRIESWKGHIGNKEACAAFRAFADLIESETNGNYWRGRIAISFQKDESKV